jgi:hypothetical protein
MGEKPGRKAWLESRLDALFSYRLPQQLAVLVYKNGEGYNGLMGTRIGSGSKGGGCRRRAPPAAAARSPSCG